MRHFNLPETILKPAIFFFVLSMVFGVLSILQGKSSNLIEDPSFEQPMEKNRWGHVFQNWSGWV